MDYTVRIEISVTADSPKEAATRALDDLRDKTIGPWTMSVADSDDRATDVSVGEAGSCIERIARMSLIHEGENPHGVTAEAVVTGQGDAFREIRVSAFAGDGHCIGDVLVGLNEQGELRALVTTDGDGDGDHAIAVYPERPGPMAIEIIEDAEEIARPIAGPRR